MKSHPLTTRGLVLAVSVVVGISEAPGDDVLWDNGLPNGVGGRSNAVSGVFGFRRTLLDDFVIPDGETWRISAFRHRHVWGTPMGGAAGLPSRVPVQWLARKGAR